MPNLYASLGALKARLKISDTNSDAVLLAILEATSREINLWTHHTFYVSHLTHTFTAKNDDQLLLRRDLVAVTSLKTDPNGDRTYGDTWATTDYDLLPAGNGADPTFPRPYWKIGRRYGGTYCFPCYVAGVQIVGDWGFYEVLQRSAATVNGTYTAGATTLAVTSGAAFDAGQTLKIESEQLYVSGISGNNLTVVPSVNGTTAATHANGTAIDVYTYPLVSEACLLQAARLWARADTALGVAGGPELGTVRLASGLDIDVKALLAPISLRSAG